MPVVTQRNLRYVFISLLLSFVMPSVVLADTFSWQGPYIGAFVGGGYGNNQVSTDAGSVTDTSYFTTRTDINAINNAGTSTKNPGTPIVGIQAGHDWVFKQMVYGIAMDYSALPLSSSSTINNTYPDNTDQYSVYTSMRTNWLFTLRGRLGYQTVLRLPSLFYLTGGLAMAQLKVNNNFNDNSALSGAGGSSTTRNQIGWTAGAGIEVATMNHVTVDFEYLYVQVPSVKTTGSITNTEGGFGIPEQSMTNLLATTASFHANLFKIALNYRFDE